MSEPFGPVGWGPAEVAIDERAPPPPRPKMPWDRIGIVAAVLGVIALAVAVFSGGSGDDASSPSSTTVAPPTTVRRPVTTSSPPSTFVDQELPSRGGSSNIGARVLLAEPPPGYAVFGANSAPWVNDAALLGGFQLFAAPGSTWANGPWVAVDTTGMAAQFVGPPTVEQIGPWSALVGPGVIGDRTVVLSSAEPVVTVVTLGLAAEATTAIAAALVVAGAPDHPIVAIPATALPAGMVLFVGDALPWAFDTGNDAVSASYARPDGALIRISTREVEPGDHPLDDAVFFLSDVRYASVGAAPAVAGRRSTGTDAVVWTRDDQLLVVTSVGASASEQLDAASSAVLLGDAGFSDDAWDDAANAGGIEIDQATIQSGVPVGDTNGTVWATMSNGWLSWWLSSRDSTVYRIEALGGLPMLRIAVEPLAPDRLGAGFTVVAMALGDASLQGATLRLRAGDELAPAGDEAALHGIIDATAFAGMWGAAASVKWTAGGVTAELIAADGVTVLATATEADLT
jgi:hypothetical protein